MWIEDTHRHFTKECICLVNMDRKKNVEHYYPLEKCKQNHNEMSLHTYGGGVEVEDSRGE